MKDNKIHIAILASCIPRDSIGISHEGEKFVVDRCVQAVNPVSSVAKSPLLKPISDEIYQYQAKESTVFTRFYHRNLMLDLNKQAIQYISGAESDWLLIDFGCLRIEILKYENGIFTNFLRAQKAESVINDLVIDGYLPKGGITIPAENISDDMLYSALEEYLKEILKHFSQDKIIIYDIHPAKFCVLKDGTISCFNEYPKHKVIQKGFDYAVKKLSQAHVIEFPVNTISDEKHKWDVSPLHYVKEYYDYAYGAVDKITGGVLFA